MDKKLKRALVAALLLAIIGAIINYISGPAAGAVPDSQIGKCRYMDQIQGVYAPGDTLPVATIMSGDSPMFSEYRCKHNALRLQKLVPGDRQQFLGLKAMLPYLAKKHGYPVVLCRNPGHGYLLDLAAFWYGYGTPGIPLTKNEKLYYADFARRYAEINACHIGLP